MKTNKGFANGQHDLKRGIDFIGVTCVFVCHDGHGRVLMHKRSKNCRDEHGRWDVGGGALEHGDGIEDTLKREIKEEYGADASELKFVDVYDVHRTLDDGTPTHWIAIIYAAKVDPKQATNNEPFKIDEIGWFKPETLPSPLHSNALKEIRAVQALGII